METVRVKEEPVEPMNEDAVDNTQSSISHNSHHDDRSSSSKSPRERGSQRSSSSRESGGRSHRDSSSREERHHRSSSSRSPREFGSRRDGSSRSSREPDGHHSSKKRRVDEGAVAASSKSNSPPVFIKVERDFFEEEPSRPEKDWLAESAKQTEGLSHNQRSTTSTNNGSREGSTHRDSNSASAAGGGEAGSSPPESSRKDVTDAVDDPDADNSRKRKRDDEENDEKDKADVGNKESLRNWFGISLQGVQPSLVEKSAKDRELGVPKARLPKVAHYNAHDEESEVKYVSEGKKKSKAYIEDHRKKLNQKDDGEGSGSDEAFDLDPYDESTLQIPHSALSQRERVYSYFNFEKRHVSATKLEVYKMKEMILDSVAKHRVVIIDGFTGCGKTTQVPQFILDEHYDKKKVCDIIVTQPRKIAAISVAKRVCFERYWTVGKIVGYQVGMDSKKERDTTLITYVTTGVLLQKLIATKSFGQMTHIIIDEVHERDLETDLLLLVIKKILQEDFEGREKHVKIILMSATLNAQKFSKYFPMRTGVSAVEQAPIIKIPQKIRRHTITEFFLDSSCVLGDAPDTLSLAEATLDMDKAIIADEIYNVAVNIIVNMDEEERRQNSDPRIRKGDSDDRLESRGSVLVFLPGMEEINRLYAALNRKNQTDAEEALKRDPEFKRFDYHEWDIVPLHSSITSEEQLKVFDPPKKRFRKIILSTNIAESSVTVPDVRYVIDFCLTKSMCIDPYTNFTTLRMVWASSSQGVQRKGRTGRVCDGKVYRLVTQSFYLRLPIETPPEMLRANLETVVLQIKKLNMGTPKDLLALALDPPMVSGIERAVANLKELGALTKASVDPNDRKRQTYDTCDGDLTFMGRIMTDLPIPQQCTRLIMLGHCFGVMKEAIVIAAALSVKSPFSNPFKKSLDAYISRLNYAKKSCSDLFALYHMYKHWITRFADGASTAEPGNTRGRSFYNERQWAKGAFVQLSVLREIKSTVELIEERILRHGEKFGSNPFHAADSSTELSQTAGLMLKMAIAGAFYPNYFHRRRPELKTYEREKSKEICGRDLMNTVYFKCFPGNHDGKVYAKYIADYLAFGLNIPSIIFDGQKVLATFDNRGEKIGPISKGIYRAVKRRQIRDQLEIPLASRDKEKEVLRDWENKLLRRRFTPCPEPVILPSVSCQRANVRVSHNESPGQFWVNYSSHAKRLDDMVNDINEELLHIPIQASRLVPNALVLAPYCDRHYRGKVLLVLPRPIDESLIYFIDYGNSGWVKNSLIEDFSHSMLEKEYHRAPCLAIECRLSSIQPATIYGTGWHECARKMFQMFADNAPSIYMEIYSVSNSVVACELIGCDPEGEIPRQENINKKLLDTGYAEEAEEPTFSVTNHRARHRVGLQDEYERNAHNKEQIGKQLDFDFLEAGLDRTQCHETWIKGPWSPLEVEFQGLCHSSNTKQIKIDNNSVNSVVLDSEPNAPIARFLVAATVGIQDRSGSVVARDTTTMPSIPGLLSIVSMIFTPTMELRTDGQKQTHYTGALCGLGTAPNDPDLPVYPDHDCEIVFDTAIDDEDIDSINIIRSKINHILRKDWRGGGDVNLSNHQKEVQDEIIKLLLRKRQPLLDEVWQKNEFMWNRIPEKKTVPPNSDVFWYKPKDIFLPHNKIELNQGGKTWSWNFAV